MSQQLISLNSDLKKLRDDGLEVQVRHGYLLITNVPYVTSNKEVKRGTLVSELTMAGGNKTVKPSTHVVHFAGEHPCNKDGTPIPNLVNASNAQSLAEGVTINHTFSSKPPQGYADYYEKMTTYIAIVSGPVGSIDYTATAKTFKVIETSEEESVFKYLDTNSSRAEINIISDKLNGHKIGIVGLGGTGSYVLDLVSKTSVQEIHLFDGDFFDQHNAFRAPGAPSIEKLSTRPKKTDYYKEIYGNLHRNIQSYPVYIGADNIEDVLKLDFVFICIDRSDVKGLLIQRLNEKGVSYIDVGMGIYNVDGKLAGILRTTTSTPTKRDHVQTRICFLDDKNNEYSTNIQISDLNMLNAALAVIKWKKLCGFYADLERENNSTYTIDGNTVLNEDNNA